MFLIYINKFVILHKYFNYERSWYKSVVWLILIEFQIYTLYITISANTSMGMSVGVYSIASQNQS